MAKLIYINQLKAFFLAQPFFPRWAQVPPTRGFVPKLFPRWAMLAVINPCNPTGEYMNVDQLKTYIEASLDANIEFLNETEAEEDLVSTTPGIKAPAPAAPKREGATDRYDQYAPCVAPHAALAGGGLHAAHRMNPCSSGGGRTACMTRLSCFPVPAVTLLF